MENFDDDRTIRGWRAQDNANLPEDDLTMKDSRSRIRDGEFKPGDRIVRGRYEVREIVGRGGMGIVYRCYDTMTRLDVALKTLPPEIACSQDEVEEIRANFALAGRLNHPNIATMRTLEMDAGRIFLVMDYVEGVSLKKWGRNHSTDGTLDFNEFMHIMKQVASALDYAHSQGVLHRDIKPQNIMVTADNTAKLLDFGLAAQVRTSMTRVSMVKQDTSGTAPYMAPEQWRGKGQRSSTDQYALAVTIYEIFAGHPPFENPDKDILRQCVLDETPDPLEQLPDYMNAALLRALSKDPKDRFDSCTSFIGAFAGEESAAPMDGKTEDPSSGNTCADSVSATEEKDVGSKTPAESPSASLSKSKRKWLHAVILLGALLVLAGGVCGGVLVVQQWFGKGSAERELLPEEVFALQTQAQTSMERMRAKAQIDRNQTFGEHLDRMEHAYKTGENALKKDNYQIAAKNFNIVLTEEKWILANIPLRESAKQLFLQIPPKQSYADKYDGKRHASSKYLEALKSLIDGNKKYESGEFASASISYRHAIEKYMEVGDIGHETIRKNRTDACNNAKNNRNWDLLEKKAEELHDLDADGANQFKIDAANGRREDALNAQLKNAKDALDKKDWMKVLEYAVVALKIDNTNQDAMKLKKKAIEEIGYYVVLLPDNTMIEMIRVEPGTFTMAHRDGENYDNEKEHQVTLTKGYWLGRTEVTQGQWQAVMGDNPSKFKDGDNYPVEQVSWDNIQKFLKKLNEMYAGTLPAGYKFDLPTEAQWEYAAQGGHKRQSYTKYAGSDNLNDVGWFDDNSGSKTHPVGQRPPNELGLHDMSGNVWEWCRDWYEEDNTAVTVDPSGPTAGSYRVLRGGGWINYARDCRVAYRNRNVPSNRYSLCGFRLALVPVQ